MPDDIVPFNKTAPVREAADQVLDRRKTNFFVVDNVVIDQYLSAIGPSAFGLYCVLARLADNKSHSCFPGLAYLMEKTGQSKNTLLKSIKTLDEHALVRVQHREDRLSNVYVLLDLSSWTCGGSKTEPPCSKIDRGDVEVIQFLNRSSSDFDGCDAEIDEGSANFEQGGSVFDSQVVQKLNTTNTNYKESNTKTIHKNTQQQDTMSQGCEESMRQKNVVDSFCTFPNADTLKGIIERESIQNQDTKTQDILAAKMIQIGVTEASARDFARKKTADVARQLDYWPYRDMTDKTNPAGLFVRAVEQNWVAPPNYETAQRAQKRQERAVVTRAAQEAQRATEEALRAARDGAREVYWCGLSEMERLNIDAEANRQLAKPLKNRNPMIVTKRWEIVDDMVARQEVPRAA
jgi:hypothetical protein